MDANLADASVRGIASNVGELPPPATLPCSCPDYIALRLLLTLTLGPFRKLLPLLSNVHKARPRLQQLEWVSHVIPSHVTIRILERLFSFALDLTGPYAPSNRPQRRRIENQSEHYDEGCDHGFERDVNWQRRVDARLCRGQGGKRSSSVRLQGRMLVG